MKKFLIQIVLIMGICFYSNSLFAIEYPDSTKMKSEIEKFNELNKDTSKKFKKFELTKSPMGAVWRSLILPGWGQFYVESYWKAPIFFCGAGILVYSIIYNNSQYIIQADLLDNTDKTDLINYANIKRQREYFRDNRDMSGFYLLGVYLLATIDAYTGAHLYDFDVDDKLLSLRIGTNSQLMPVVLLRIEF